MGVHFELGCRHGSRCGAPGVARPRRLHAATRPAGAGRPRCHPHGSARVRRPPPVVADARRRPRTLTRRRAGVLRAARGRGLSALAHGVGYDGRGGSRGDRRRRRDRETHVVVRGAPAPDDRGLRVRGPGPGLGPAQRLGVGDPGGLSPGTERGVRLRRSARSARAARDAGGVPATGPRCRRDRGPGARLQRDGAGPGTRAARTPTGRRRLRGSRRDLDGPGRGTGIGEHRRPGGRRRPRPRRRRAGGDPSARRRRHARSPVADRRRARAGAQARSARLGARSRRGGAGGRLRRGVPLRPRPGRHVAGSGARPGRRARHRQQVVGTGAATGLGRGAPAAGRAPGSPEGHHRPRHVAPRPARAGTADRVGPLRPAPPAGARRVRATTYGARGGARRARARSSRSPASPRASTRSPTCPTAPTSTR